MSNDEWGEKMSENKELNDHLGIDKFNMSKNILIPAMLLHLKEISTHGYELMQQMTEFGIQSIDKGNFYRTLRKLEQDNMVTSAWDTNSTGPAKRIYSLTEAGELYLEMWAKTLDYQQQLLNQFFNLYNPFITKVNVDRGEIEKDR